MARALGLYDTARLVVPLTMNGGAVPWADLADALQELADGIRAVAPTLPHHLQQADAQYKVNLAQRAIEQALEAAKQRTSEPAIRRA